MARFGWRLVGVWALVATGGLNGASAQNHAPAGGAPPRNEPPPPPAPAPTVPESPFDPYFKAAQEALPPDWGTQRKTLSVKEVLDVLDKDLDANGRSLIRKLTLAEVLAASHPTEKQMCVVQIVRFDEQASAQKYLELLHHVTKTRFQGASGKRGATYEIVDEKSNIFGVDAAKRLVIKTTQYGRSGHQFINRFIVGPTFVEVSSIVDKEDVGKEKPVTDAIVNSLRSKK